MYDFHYGSKDQIRQNPEEFLIFVKRLLPRWINGIPDSECVAIYRTLVSMNKKDSTLIETGCGASTLAMFLYAVLNDAHIFSWDTNGSRGSFLRSVISEAICRPLEVDLYRYWTFIGFDSTDSHVGIPIIEEIGLSADFGFSKAQEIWEETCSMVSHQQVLAFAYIEDRKVFIVGSNQIQ